MVDHAVALAPPGWVAERAELGPVPLYDQDLEDAGAPDPVRRLRVQVTGADAVLFATPQYNHGISGVLKNAIDWLSRPAFAGVLVGKPVVVTAATNGKHPPAEAVGQAETALEVCLARVLRPGLALTSVTRRTVEHDPGRFDPELTAELAELMERFARFVAETPETDTESGGGAA